MDHNLGSNLESLLQLAPLGAKCIRDQLPSLAMQYERMIALEGPLAVHATGLPTDSTIESTPLGDFLSLSLASLVGEPFQYLQQNSGRLVARLTPSPGLEGKPNTGEGSGEFEFHTDDRILAPSYSTELIQLLGIRNDSMASTRFLTLPSILSRLSRKSWQTLSEKRYLFKPPISFGAKMPAFSDPLPVLWQIQAGHWQIGFPIFNCYPSRTDDEAARDALTELITLLRKDRSAFRFVIGPGCLLTFLNNHGLHARAPFSGYRLLLRTYIRKDLSPLRLKSQSSGNVFDADLLLS